jgi:hypothetical protein
MNLSKEPCLTCPVSLFCVVGVRFDVFLCSDCGTPLFVDALKGPRGPSIPSFCAPKAFDQEFLDTLQACDQYTDAYRGGLLQRVHPLFRSGDECYACSVRIRGKSP